MDPSHNSARNRREGFDDVGRDKKSATERAKSKITGVLGRSTSSDGSEKAGGSTEPSCGVCHDSFDRAAFQCRYCETDHCEAHRLPEDHYCPNVDWSGEFEDRYSDLFEEPVTPRSSREQRERWWQEHDDGLPYEGRRI
jgi:hypothetical protein